MLEIIMLISFTIHNQNNYADFNNDNNYEIIMNNTECDNYDTAMK